MNKALELIEASYLFDVPEGQIDVVVHPQSIIHSLVAYRDGSVLAQLGSPDMKTPIAHALSWPDRRLPTEVPRLSLAEIARLDFSEVDHARFPAIRLARQSLNEGGAAPVILNAANECAVAAFLAGDCRFTDIGSLVQGTLDKAGQIAAGAGSELGLEEILDIDREARNVCARLLGQTRERTRSNVQ